MQLTYSFYVSSGFNGLFSLTELNFERKLFLKHTIRCAIVYVCMYMTMFVWVYESSLILCAFCYFVECLSYYFYFFSMSCDVLNNVCYCCGSIASFTNSYSLTSKVVRFRIIKFTAAQHVWLLVLVIVLYNLHIWKLF